MPEDDTWPAEYVSGATLPEAWPALYATGATIRQIAMASGRTFYAVRLELLTRGVVMRDASPSAAWAAEAAALRAEGYTLRALGRRYGVTRQAVSKVLLKRR
jgi:hypothetical protein